MGQTSRGWWKMGPNQLGLGILGVNVGICAPWGASFVQYCTSCLTSSLFSSGSFVLPSHFFFFFPYFVFPLLFPFCQHFLLVNESKKEFLGGAGIIWTFLGSDRGWRCWQLCQSPAEGFVMWALECPIWERAGAKLTHSHIFPGMCSCTYVQGREKPVKVITPAHPSSILLPGLLWILLLLPAPATDTDGEGKALPGAWPGITPRQSPGGTGGLHAGSSRLVRAGNAIPELSLCPVLGIEGWILPSWMDLSPCPRGNAV